MSKSFTAKYPGRCAGCEDGIEIGDSLTYDTDGLVVHGGCQETVNQGRLRPVQVCPRCFVTVPASGVCECDE